MKRFLALTIITVTLTTAGIGYAGPPPPATEPVAPPPVVSHGGPVTDYVSLFDNLRAAGTSVVPAGDVSQPFFSVTGNAIPSTAGMSRYLNIPITNRLKPRSLSFPRRAAPSEPPW